MHKFFGFICLMLLFACDKEKEFRSTSLQTPVVTGFIFKDSNGNPLYSAGTPNVRTNFETEGFTYFLSAYPNPVQYQVAVQLNTNRPANKITIWVVAAQQDQNLNSFNFMQANTLLAGGQPLAKVEATGMQNSFTLDLRHLPAGAYRVYAQIDDVLLWDNILKTN